MQRRVRGGSGAERRECRTQNEELRKVIPLSSF
jgi:hypothetical protein